MESAGAQAGSILGAAVTPLGCQVHRGAAVPAEKDVPVQDVGLKGARVRLPEDLGAAV